MSINMRGRIITVICFGLITWSSIALADGWPPVVAGDWNVKANQTSGTLSIIDLPPPTLQNPSYCHSIFGYIFGNGIFGFYCPGSGRIEFTRFLNQIPYQYYSANVSVQGLFMGGTFTVWDSGTDNGEYSFQANRP